MSSLVASAQTEAQDPGTRTDCTLQILELVSLAALTAIALTLRASQLHQTLAGDEIFTYQDVVRRGFTAVVTTVHVGGENSPPLFFVLAWLSSKLGNPSIWIRTPSLVLGTATVPLVYAVGRQSVGRAAGLIAAGIMALAPFAVLNGVEARPYATMTFFVALSTLAVVLGAGTARSFEPAYARGPFRTIAAYLDRVAGPRDPIRLSSVDGSLAVREEIQRPHLLVDSLSAMRSHTAVGGRAYRGRPRGLRQRPAAQTPRSPAWRRPRRLQSAARRV